MRVSTILTWFLPVALSLPMPAQAADQNATTRGGTAVRYALIYNGPGSAEDGPAAVAAVSKQAGLSVKYVSSVADIPELLPGAALLAIGGTDDDIEPLRKRFTPGVVSAIQDYVRSGGRFAGFCGGGYLASQGYDNDEGFVHCLGIVPATSDSYLEDSAARTLSIQWRGTRRNMFYQFGPKFIPKKSSEAVEVVGKYDDGSIAALLCTYGKGKALVSGPHPEANDSWRDEIKGGESDWTPEPEVATAAIRDLLSDRAVGK